MPVQTLAVPGATPRPLLYQGSVPGQRPTQIAITPSSHLWLRCSWAFKNHHAMSYALLMALALCLLVSVGGRRSQRLGPSPTLGSLGPSHQWRHKSQVSLRGFPCAHGVSGTPHGEVRDICPLRYWTSGSTRRDFSEYFGVENCHLVSYSLGKNLWRYRRAYTKRNLGPVSDWERIFCLQDWKIWFKTCIREKQQRNTSFND